MGKTIAIVNQKGGVGKTTTSVNLTAAIGALGKRVLMVDADPQGNATSGLAINKRELTYTVYDMLINSVAPDLVVVKTGFDNVDILPASMALAGAELELADMRSRESRLKDELSKIKDKYDYIFIDCPPSLGLITLNALCAADTFIVPIQCEYYALEGLSHLISTVRKVKRLYNEKLDIEGVLLTMFDGRLNLTQQVVAEVKKYFPQKVYATVIPRTVRLAEAPSFGQPILYFDKSSKGSKAYYDLAREFLDNNMRRRIN